MQVSIKSRDDAVDSTSRVLRLNWNHLAALIFLPFVKKVKATSQRFPSLRHVLWTIETISEHTIILIQTEDWIRRQEEVVGAIVVVQELLRSLRVPTRETRLAKRRGCRIRDH